MGARASIASAMSSLDHSRPVSPPAIVGVTRFGRVPPIQPRRGAIRLTGECSRPFYGAGRFSLAF